MKKIKVVCAILEREGRVLVAQRSAQMAEPLLWEFPGGKVERDEQEQEALVREIQEELGLLIQPTTRLQPVVHTYPAKTIELVPYICTHLSGAVQLAEHQAYAWSLPQDLLEYDWCPADVPIVKEYLRLKGTSS